MEITDQLPSMTLEEKAGLAAELRHAIAEELAAPHDGWRPRRRPHCGTAGFTAGSSSAAATRATAGSCSTPTKWPALTGA